MMRQMRKKMKMMISFSPVASAREQDMEIYEKRKGHEQLDEQQNIHGTSSLTLGVRAIVVVASAYITSKICGVAQCVCASSCEEFVVEASIPALKQPSGIAAHDGKRPDGCTLIPWRAGRCLAWDVTIPGTFAERYVQLTSKESGLAATRASDEKIKKYDGALPSMEFYRFVSRSSAPWTVTPPGFSIEFAKISVLGQAIDFTSFGSP
ncbi:hypothetical protein HELRODRAFT_170475 [Helobdella robusta]|uniref:Uncharacterized protein n=1 Tax=Helobdella robusta TaxID=6412 RepID=T1F339_HELRO|nr:hypothetical protein HELRODRAFT_170475 [Helobdella robusta]ESO07166.1 hypothetical protein HELRODRAFT_170475 [Helobdella robusta]